MSVDVSGRSGSERRTPQRFVPLALQGRLMEAERLVRYRWAASIASVGRILDAGCGQAYGTKILAQSGADEVIGVDPAAPVLDAARADMPDNVRLEAGDIRNLSYADDSFDMVVCFEVIEHLDELGVALDELTRVLAPDGLLLVSCPDLHPAASSQRRHGLLPQQLGDELEKRLRDVRLLHQQNYLASAIVTDAVYAERADAAVDTSLVHSLAAGSSDRETFTLAVATNGPLLEAPTVTMLTGSVDWADVFNSFEEQDAQLMMHQQRIYELEQQLIDQQETKQRLIEAEQGLGIAGLEERLEAAHEEIAELTRELERTRGFLGDVVTSASWRLTAPLRAAKRMLENRP